MQDKQNVSFVGAVRCNTEEIGLYVVIAYGIEKVNFNRGGKN